MPRRLPLLLQTLPRLKRTSFFQQKPISTSDFSRTGPRHSLGLVLSVALGSEFRVELYALAPYTPRMPLIQTTDLKLHYDTAGNGDPVLFISGTGGDLRQRPNVLDGPLAKTRRVIAYDQRGLGQSEKPDRVYSMEDYGDDAARLLDALGIDHVDVVGVSFGGMVAQHFALRHPKRLRKLVLCCTSPGGEMPSYPFHELPQDLSPTERLLRLMDVSDTRRDHAWQKANPDKVSAMIEAAQAGAIEDHQQPESKLGAWRQLEARAGHDTVDQLPALSTRTLICAGRFDGIAPPVNQEWLASLIPNAELKWYEGGHLFMIQDRRAWPDIISFLNDCSS